MTDTSIIRLKLVDIVGSPNCVDTVDGHKINEAVSEQLGLGNSIVLSFEGVERITTAFLNAAVGQLYNEFSEEVIRQHLRFEDITSINPVVLTRVIQRAKEYFSDPEKFDAATRDALEDD